MVCLAALSAIEFGRKCLWSKSKSSALPDGPSPARSDLVNRVATLASDKFWFFLSDFVQVRSGPPKKWEAVGPDHPFLCVREGHLALSRHDLVLIV